MTGELRDNDVSDRRARARSALRGSRVAGVATELRDRLAALGHATGDVVRESFIYRWLTKEPEPEVVVIDLRETRTVGPVVRVLDRVIDRVAPLWRRSSVKAGLDRAAALVERGLRTRPGKLLVALLEPPEPPERLSEGATAREQGSRNDTTGVDDESKIAERQSDDEPERSA